MLAYPVGTAQILADKVSQDMTVFVKRHVLSAMSIGPELNWRDMFVLSQILRYPEGLIPAEISANTRMDPATVLRANLKLQKHGYITIIEQAFDARSNLVQFTPKGATLLQLMFKIYLEKQEVVFERYLSRLDVEDIRDIFTTCLDVQADAEKFASLLTSGKIRRDDRTSYSRVVLNDSFEAFSKFPEFILQVYCRRISSDYMTFLKSHAMSSMSHKTLRKSREMLTLISLDYLGSPTTSMDVARLMRFDPATTTRAASILTNEAFILPSAGHKSDDRKKPLVLSEKGIEAVAEYKNLMASKAEHAKSLLDLDGSYDEVKKQLGTLSFLANRTEILASLKPGQLT